MKFLGLQVLALCGLAALAAQSTAAEDFISTCDVECVGPFNACSWETMDGKVTMADCNRQNEQCLKDCYAKNGRVKFVYKEKPHPDAVDTPEPTAKKTKKPKTKEPKTKEPKTKEPKTKEPKTKAPSYNFRSVDDGEPVN